MHKAAKIIMYRGEHIMEEMLPPLSDATHVLGATSTARS